MTGVHPWHRFRALAQFTLRWHNVGPRGVTDFEAQTVSLRRDLTQAGRRSTILHECLHIERGAVPMGMAAGEEIRVRKLTAGLLLPDVEAVGDALIWGQGHVEPAAAELWVDLGVLKDRLRFCSPAEREYLMTRLREEAPTP